MIRAGLCGRRGLMKWKDLSGQERYHVVQMAREGKVSIKELCRGFGVSRQTLKTAMDKAEHAAMEALTPKSPGRKGKSKQQVEAEAMKQEKDEIQKELELWRQKYEVAMAFVHIHKKLLNGEALSEDRKEPKRSGKKKNLKGLRNPKSAKAAGLGRTATEVGNNDDG
jgi:transposase-like protein